MMKLAILNGVTILVVFGGCAHEQPASIEGESLPYASQYQALDSKPTLLNGATVLTGTGERLEGASILMRDGKIVAVGSELDAGGAISVDAGGMWITPGVIDVHSHLGVYASPGV
ncbi:MAG: amidohydrolase, partial [Deltaproteobacteria bacterium]|nr:amidohydrolase [Deltaproteobacteria bacterium]